jgi:hypothetical protein
MTLLELSVMILVLLSFVAILFIGVHAWKRGADRAGCIMNIRQVQLAVRSYANTEDLDEGTDTRRLSPPLNLLDELVGADRFLARLPVCPGTGLYTFGGSIIPPRGNLYMTCTLARSKDHVPNSFGSW